MTAQPWMPEPREPSDMRVPEYEHVRPLKDKILLQYVSDEHVSAGGIIMNPESAMIEEERTRKARVVSVGPGRKAQSTGLERDDIVLVGKWRGTELSVPPGCQPYVIVDVNWGDEPKQGVKSWIGAKVEQ